MKQINWNHLNLIAAACLTLTLLVTAFSRTPYQSKDSNTQTPTLSKEQDAQKAIQNGELTRLVAASNKLLKDYPTTTQIDKIDDPKIRSIVERGRKLLEAGKSANGWNARQLSDYSGQLQQHTQDAAKAKGTTVGNVVCGITCGLKENSCKNGCIFGTATEISNCKFFCAVNGLICSMGCKTGTKG